MLQKKTGERSGHTPARGQLDPRRDLRPRSGGILWVLSDQRVRFCLDGGGSSGETRRLHKHAVAGRAAEVHSVLHGPVVLPCRGIHKRLAFPRRSNVYYKKKTMRKYWLIYCI